MLLVFPLFVSKYICGLRLSVKCIITCRIKEQNAMWHRFRSLFWDSKGWICKYLCPIILELSTSCMYAGYEYQTSKGLKYGAVFCSRRSNICQLKFSFCFRHFSCYGLIGSIHNYIQMDREVCKMKAATSLHVFGEWLNTHTLQQSKGMVLRQGSVNSFMYNVWIGQVSSVP